MNTLPALFEERMRKLLPEESEAFFAALQTRASCQYPAEPGKTRPHLPVIPRRANRFTRILVRIGLLFEEPPRFHPGPLPT